MTPRISCWNSRENRSRPSMPFLLQLLPHLDPHPVALLSASLFPTQSPIHVYPWAPNLLVYCCLATVLDMVIHWQLGLSDRWAPSFSDGCPNLVVFRCRATALDMAIRWQLSLFDRWVPLFPDGYSKCSGAAVKILEWVAFGHGGKLRDRPARLNRIPSDTPFGSDRASKRRQITRREQPSGSRTTPSSSACPRFH